MYDLKNSGNIQFSLHSIAVEFMVFLTELEEALLRMNDDSLVLVSDSSGNTIGMNKVGLSLSEKDRLEIIAASADPTRTSADLTLNTGSRWEISREVLESVVLVHAKPVERMKLTRSEDRSYSVMLNSISSAIFDASVYLDSEFHLKAVSPQFRALLSVPSSHVLVGSPFKDLISGKADRERFEMYVESILASACEESSFSSTQSTSASSSCVASSCGSQSVALMLEVVAGIDRPVNIRMYVTGAPNAEYFMGIIATQEYAVPIVCGTQRPVKVRETLSTVSTGDSTYLSNLMKDNQTAALLGSAEEDVDDSTIFFEHPLSVQRDSKPLAPPHISLVSIFYRVLNRDLLALVDFAKVESYPGLEGWITPLFQITDVEAIKEDIVRLLPNDKQEIFMKADLECDLQTCSSIMEDSTVGNLNVLSWSRFKIPRASAHHFCAISRFILSKLQYMKGEDLVPFYENWMEGYEGLNVFCSSMRATIALSVISCAIKRPEVFSSDSQTQHLRLIFSNLISTTDSFGVTDHVRLPAVYVACILWARLQMDRKRPLETVQILRGAVADMHQYCMRHPGSRIIKLLQAIAIFDLATLAIAQNDSHLASFYIQEMETNILNTTNPKLMGSTHAKIANWLNTLKSYLRISN